MVPISWQRHRKVIRLSPWRTSRLHPQKILLALISCLRLSRPQGHSAIGFYVNEKFHWHLLSDNQRCVDVFTTGDTAHIDTIFKFLHTKASTWMHRYSSLLQWSVPLSYRGHVGRIHCTLHSNHRLTGVIFQHTKRILPHRERPFSHYIHSHRQRQKYEPR
jgi:hypothetical protein